MKLARYCLALAWLSQPGLAQEQTWYQVELMVFAHGDNSVGSAERWPALPALSYPTEYRFITDPAEVAALADKHGGASRLDDRGVQHLVVPASVAEPLPVESDEATTADPQPVASDAAPVFNPLLAGSPPDAGNQLETVTLSGTRKLQPALDYEELRRRSWPPMFSVLPAERLEFARRARSVAGRGGEVLFHQSWIQPVAGQAEALPIIIDRSGDLGVHPRLQGSVTLYLSRYLHLQTNLWINTMGEYFDLDWQIPAPPLSPVSRTVTVKEPARSILQMYPGARRSDETTTAEPGLYVTSQEQIWAGGDIAGPDSGLFNVETGVLHESMSSRRHPPWSWKHAVLMEQSRRMRSEEVHYLDHPLLGVVVKLTPLQADQLDLFLEPTAGTDSRPAAP